MYLDDVEGFAVGQDVDIVHDNEFFRASVRKGEFQHSGEYVVDFACEQGAEVVSRWKEAASMPPVFTPVLSGI